MDATIDHGSLQTHRVKTSKDWISTCDFELALDSHYHLVEGEGGKNTIIFIFRFLKKTRQRLIFIAFVSFISVEIDEKLDLMTPEKYHLLLTSGSMGVTEGTNNDLRDIIDGKELDTPGAWISSETKIDFSNPEVHLPATGRLLYTGVTY